MPPNPNGSCSCSLASWSRPPSGARDGAGMLGFAAGHGPQTLMPPSCRSGHDDQHLAQMILEAVQMGVCSVAALTTARCCRAGAARSAAASSDVRLTTSKVVLHA